MKKEMKILGIFSIFVIFLVIAQISALDDDRERRINFGHVMVIDKIEMQPEYISPGKNGAIKVTLRNNANFELTDVRVELDLPDEIKFLNSVSKKKIGKIESGETLDLMFNIISDPGAGGGAYSANITVDYVNHIGDERQDSDEFGILVIKSIPKIFIKVDSTEIYKGNNLGEITLTFVNNNLANLKFLTVELLESEDYKIISANKEYIGDLDSDDFESIDFKLSIDKKKEIIPLKLKLSYMDALNKEYSERLDVPFEVLSSKELGIVENRTTRAIIIGILIIGAGYYFYKKRKKKKIKMEKYK